MNTSNHTSISGLPASRFPDPADHYFCDDCGRDLTRNLYPDRAPLWQPLRPMWYACQCGRKYMSGAAEWDDLSSWQRKQRLAQLSIGFLLFALVVIPATLAYFALRYGGAALLAVVGIALIPSILAAKPFGFIVLDVCEIVASIWRTRLVAGRPSPGTRAKQRIAPSRPHRFELSAIAAVVALLIITTPWILPHRVTASRMRAFLSPETSKTAAQEQSLAPSRLQFSRPEQTVVPGAPSPEFRRVQVGANEIDYIADDVTIRRFMPALARPRAQRAYKEVHFGPDVTMRYFSPNSTVGSKARPVSLDQSTQEKIR